MPSFPPGAAPSGRFRPSSHRPVREAVRITMTTAADGGPALQVAPAPWSLLPEVTVTPLARGDTGAIQQVFDGLSPGSRYLRFLTPARTLSPALADRLADVDHDHHGCWVARIGDQPVGIGRYIRTATDPTVAEIALEVVDACQGLGLGRLLFEVLGAAAADVGVTSFLWLVDEANYRVRRLAERLGGRFTLEYGTLEGTTPLPQVADLDAAQIRRCARAARRLAAAPAAA